MADAPLRFRGTAHPQADPIRANQADLSNAEITTMDLGSRGRTAEGTPVLVEHTGAPVGRILSSYKGRDGALKVAGTIHDPSVKESVRRGDMRGLSLRTQVMSCDSQPGIPLIRTIEEVSVCETPRRPGCWVDTIDDRPVAASPHLASRALKPSATPGMCL